MAGDPTTIGRVQGARDEHFTGKVRFGPLSDQGPLSALGVSFEPGARTDWHGARPNSPMTHLSLTTGGTTWEPSKVTDEEYKSPGLEPPFYPIVVVCSGRMTTTTRKASVAGSRWGQMSLSRYFLAMTSIYGPPGSASTRIAVPLTSRYR